MRGRNTENLIMKLDHEVANYQGKRYVLMKIFHEEKHVIFNPAGAGRRKKEISDKIRVVVAIVGQGFGIKNLM